MWQFAEAVRGWPRRAASWPAGHRRQRQPLQPDRRRRDQTPRGHRCPRRVRRRPHAACPGRWRHAGETSCCWRDRRSRRLGWASVVHGHLGAGRRVDLAAERRSGAARRAGRGPGSLRARPRRRRLRRPGRVGAAPRHRRTAPWLGGPVHRAVQRVPRALVTTTDPGRAAPRPSGPASRSPSWGDGRGALVRRGLRLPLGTARRLDGTLPALFGAPETAVGTVPAGPCPPADAGVAPIPAEELRDALAPTRAWLAGEAGQPARAGAGGPR
jgi:phosphoribosylformylglycinamidine synthase